MQAGFWVDLQTVQLTDTGDGASSWIQLMPLGSYSHPVYGKIEFTPERVARFAQNFNDRVRGTDIDIDYDHKEDKAQGSRAAGWLRQVADRGVEGLWGLVEWTKAAAAAIRAGEYRYFSPEFTDEWEHPQTKVKHKDVLFGGGLTNRPFLKDILPVNLTEVFGHETTATGGQMEELIKKLAEALGLTGDDATDEKIVAKVKELVEKPPAKEPTKEAKNEPDPELVKLSESNPLIAKMLQEREEDRQRLVALEAASQLSEVKLEVKALSDHGVSKGVALGKANQDLLEEIMVGSRKELREKIAKLITGIYDDGMVELSEIGQRRQTGGKDAHKAFDDAIKKFREENEGMSYSDAVSAVARQHPELWEAHTEALYEGSDV